jgi:uncharacterized protein YdhG (YjbR/CyaY superfamily)
MDNSNNTFSSIDEYIGTFPEKIREPLEALRQAVRESAPDAVEAISYQMPTYKLNGNLVHFAAYKKHIGFYPTPSGITAFLNELKPFKFSKGAIQFPLDQPLPLDLVKKIVRFRVNENLNR